MSIESGGIGGVLVWARAEGSSTMGRSRSGTAVAILAIRSSAARASAGSPRAMTHCAPNTAASISSEVSVSGGMSKPASST